MRATLLALALANSVPVSRADETEIRVMAWLALSQDGETLAFKWLNEIGIAPSKGGKRFASPRIRRAILIQNSPATDQGLCFHSSDPG